MSRASSVVRITGTEYRLLALSVLTCPFSTTAEPTSPRLGPGAQIILPRVISCWRDRAAQIPKVWELLLIT
jgi:hypothetical protein